MINMKAASKTDALRKAVQLVFEDRIAKACSLQTIIKFADAYANNNGIGIEQLFEEVDFYEIDNENLTQEELAGSYYTAKREFEAKFIKEHMTNLHGRIFGRWLAHDAAFEAVQDPDVNENRKLMDALGADININGIKPIL
jgi:hypothetical protein